MSCSSESKPLHPDDDLRVMVTGKYSVTEKGELFNIQWPYAQVIGVHHSINENLLGWKFGSRVE